MSDFDAADVTWDPVPIGANPVVVVVAAAGEKPVEHWTPEVGARVEADPVARVIRDTLQQDYYEPDNAETWDGPALDVAKALRDAGLLRDQPA